jgi:CDP-glycerol glycerophosphotransferase
MINIKKNHSLAAVKKNLLTRFPIVEYVLKVIYINISRLLFRCKYHRNSVIEQSFLFECFKGKMVNDSPFALYQYLISHHAQARFTWVLDSSEHPLYVELQKKRNTRVVIYGSKEYFLAYAQSKYWIVNCRIPFQLVKKQGQIFIQCWHGTPLKKLGRDITTGNNTLASQASTRYMYLLEAKRVDYFVSPSRYASECFISSFGLQKSQILELGYPRNDALIKYSHDSVVKNEIKKSLNIAVYKTIILYAPTFRDNVYCNKRQSHILSNPLENIDFLDRFDDQFVFLYRGHYFAGLENESSRFIDVSDYNDVNDLFLISDLLITDYSSLFFDFAILNKPILFFMYDRKEYESKTRGFYLNIDRDLPGRISTVLPTLANDIFTVLAEQQQLSSFNTIFNPREDGCSAERVVKAVTNNESKNDGS